MRSKNATVLDEIFQEADKFIQNLDPQRSSPPFIVNSLPSIRSRAYSQLTSQKYPDYETKANHLRQFIEKFELEYVETLREKLKPRYIDYIQQKRYNLPDEVNLKELKEFGAVDETNQMMAAVAEWSLELEILAYTMEGIKLYGLQDFSGTEKKDFISALKYGYAYSKKASFQSISEYVVRKIVSFSLARFSSMALLSGVTRIQMGVGTIVQIFLKFSLENQMPWGMILGFLNLHWVMGGIAASFALKKLNEYVIQDEALANLNQVYKTFENNKLHLMTERKNLIEYMTKLLSKSPEERSPSETKKLSKMVENLLNPKEEAIETGEVDSGEIEMFDVKDVDDLVIVDDKDHKEKLDNSGFLVVDW